MKLDLVNRPDWARVEYLDESLGAADVNCRQR
jgi:hypothetical protein